MYGVRIKHNIENVSPEGNQKLQIWVDEYTSDMDPNIFVYQRIQGAPKQGYPYIDKFVNIASVADLVEYPENTPNNDYPFFRLYYVDLEFKSPDKLNRAWTMIKADITDLIDNLNKNSSDDYADTETVVI